MFFHVRYAKIVSMRKIKTLITITAYALLCTILFAGCGETPTVYYDAGMAYLEKGDVENAIINFTLSIENESETRDNLRGLGIAYIEAGRYDEAVTVLLRALSKSTGPVGQIDYDINYYLGYAYEKGGNYDAALETYSAIITLRPKDTDAYYRRALCYLKMGESTLANEDFLKVTAKKNDDYDLHIQIYFSIKNAGFEREAGDYLKAILTEENRKISDYDRGRMCYYLGEYSDARVYLEKSKDLSNADTILMLGKTYEAIDDFSYAASLYAEYLDKQGNNAAVYNQLGVCRQKLGDYEGALVAFSFGLKLEDPEWTRELLFNEAVAYEYLLDFDSAADKMEEYFSLYPKDENALHEMEFLKTRKTLDRVD